MKKLLISILSALIAFGFVVSPSVGIAQTTDVDFQNALNQLRESRKAFKDSKAEEANEAEQEGKAKGQAQREAAQQRKEAARQKMEDKRKETLLRLIDIRVKQLNRTNERVQRKPNITDDLKAQLAAEINDQIQELNAQKTVIDGTEGKEGIKALAKELRELFKAKHEIVKNIVDAIHASRANAAAARAEERAAAIGAKVKELKGEGKDTTEIEQDLEEAEGDINDAQEDIGRQAFREANEDLKGAYQKFREIAQKAKGL
ncbi:MAG: hypothetical protein KJI71_04845 [Patescibacteria group bacterium]|nr:hypothetical protein [Patescibacteria group bacterium]